MLQETRMVSRGKDGNKKYRDKVRVSSFEFPPRSSKKSSDESSEEITETHEEADSKEALF